MTDERLFGFVAQLSARLFSRGDLRDHEQTLRDRWGRTDEQGTVRVRSWRDELRRGYVHGWKD